MTHGRSVITRSSPVSSFLPYPKASKESGTVARPDFSRCRRRFSTSPPLLAGAVQREAGLVLLNDPQPASHDASDLWRLCHDAAAPRRNPFRLEAPSRAFVRFCFQKRSFASGEDVSDVTSSSSAAARTSSVERERSNVAARTPFFVSISRRARASRQLFVFTKVLRSGPGFTPTTSRPFGSRTFSRSFHRLGSGPRSRAILPALSSARRHSCAEIPAS